MRAVEREPENLFRSTIAPSRCGPCELKHWIGGGGMGSVYQAERVDGEVRVQVAVKLLREDLGDSASMNRFLQEREILAKLSHPNIARLMDAGHTNTEEGPGRRPYLVMELVEGKPIDEFCQGLSVRETLTRPSQLTPVFAHFRASKRANFHGFNVALAKTSRVKTYPLSQA
jgi:hypothetical protein